MLCGLMPAVIYRERREVFIALEDIANLLGHS
jgi:hypothetical protein